MGKFDDLYRETISQMVGSVDDIEASREALSAEPSTYRRIFGETEFVSPFRFMKSGEDFASQSLQGNPRRFIDPSDPSYQESIFAEPSALPSIDTGGISGQIRGLPKSIAKAVRKQMQQEIKARGPSPFGPKHELSIDDIIAMEPSAAQYRDMMEFEQGLGMTPKKSLIRLSQEGNLVDTPELEALVNRLEASAPLDESDVISRLLRGTWYRGQAEYPTGHTLKEVVGPQGVEKAITTRQFGKEYAGEAPTFMGLRTNLSNLGEPHGASLSYDPTISTGFKAPRTLSEAKVKGVSVKLSEASKEYSLHGGEENKAAWERFQTADIRANQLANTHKVARVMPLFGGTPEDKVLFPWREEHGKIFRDTYLKVARDMSEAYPGFRKVVEELPPGQSGKPLGDALERVKNIKEKSFFTYDDKNIIHEIKGKYKTWDEFTEVYEAKAKEAGISPEIELASQGYNPKYKSAKDEFNTRMSDELRAQGWKGMLHHPDRGSYGEYEMRIFDPYNVMYIDTRPIPRAGHEFESNKMTSQSAGRLRRMKEPLKEAHQEVTSGKTRSLADWYKDITREEILGLKPDMSEVAQINKGAEELNSMLDDWGDNAKVDWKKAQKAFGKPAKLDFPGLLTDDDMKELDKLFKE